MKINILAERPFAIKGGGVYAAIEDNNRILRSLGAKVEINSKEPCDILHCHSFGLRYLQYAKKYSGRCCIIADTLPEQIFDRIAFSKYFSGIVSSYLSYAYNKADLVIALSNYAKKRLEEIGVKSKIAVVPQLNDWSFLKRQQNNPAKFREYVGAGKNDFLVLCVGNILYSKGIEIFCRVAKELPEFKFVWVGKTTGLLATPKWYRVLYWLINKPKNVKFLGYLPSDGGLSLASAYSAADVFFFPSLSENSPRVIPEAAAFNLPLVLNDLPPYRDIYHGKYIGAKTVSEFVSILRKLSSDQKTCAKYSKLASGLTKTFEPHKIAKKLLRIYAGLIAGSKISLS